MLSAWIWHAFTLPYLAKTVWQTVRTAGPTDFFDIAAVTIIIYLFLRWMHRARAVRVIQGMLIITLIYGLASQMGLVLTTSFFRGLVTLILISLASVFQEDVHHFFEGLTVLKHDPMHRRMAQALVRTVRHFSQDHIGALIIIRGHDPLNRHLDGGQVLNGRLSSALLESLFDPHSDGHDGAVIVEGDVVTHFGVHLPLSKHLPHDSGLGTRHAAALGLSELTDAFCLVVSETKGTIMVARDGHLANLEAGERLEPCLDDFLKEKFETAASSGPLRLLTHHSLEKLISLVLGLALWLVAVKGIRPKEQGVPLPVRLISNPTGLHVDTISPPLVTVTFRGLERDFRMFPKDLAVSVKAAKSKSKYQHIPLKTEMVQAPPNLIVAGIEPERVTLYLKSAHQTKIVMSRSPQAAPRHSWFGFH